MEALELVADWPVDRVAVGVVSASEVVATWGLTDAILAWASLTKLVTAYTVFMVVGEGIVELDDPVGPEGVTLRHLLAHTSGLPLDGDEPISGPGRRRIYSNAGFELLAAHVAGRTGIDFAELATENVLEPLGMDATTFAGSPAAGIEGPLDDLLAFASELQQPSLVSRDLLGEATSVQFEGVGGVLPGFGRQEPNDWGLGFEIRDGKDPHWTGSRNSPATFGHFGLAGSFLWVDPDARVACAGLADRDFGAWAKEVWPALSDAVLTESAT